MPPILGNIIAISFVVALVALSIHILRQGGGCTGSCSGCSGSCSTSHADTQRMIRQFKKKTAKLERQQKRMRNL